MSKIANRQLPMRDLNKFSAHEERLERLLDQLQPGWRQELVFKRFLPHMAASYGTPLAKLAGASGLASPALAEHSNVFVCGDYVGNSAQLADCAVKSVLDAVAML